MTWFKVDDKFHSHPKVRATDPAALGLWVVAGSWVSAHLTDGFVSDAILPTLLPGAAKLARKLVAAGLWERSDTGYRFHDWHQANPTAEKENARKADQARRQAEFRERRNAQRNASRNAESNALRNGGSHSVRPDPPKGGGEGGAPLRGGGAPPSKPNPTQMLTTGRVVCATHHQELPCISCASDAKALGTDDLDQRPPMPAAPPDRPADTASIQLRAELAAARHTLHISGNPDHWLDTARDTLIRAGTPPDQVSATDTLLLAVDLCRAADLATRPDPTTGPS